MLEEVARDRVAHLVVGGDQTLLLAHHARLLLGAGDHAHDPLLELDLADLALARPGGEQRGLVDQVRQVGAGEARGLPRERVDVDDLRQRLAARVDLEDLRPALAVGAVDGDLAVEAAGAQQRRVEDVGPVGGRDHDDVVLRLEPVHLDEQLVERLLALVVPAAEPRAAVAPDGVDLVHEDDARAVLLGLLEQVPDARGADADEHLDEVRARRSRRTARPPRRRPRAPSSVLPVPGGPYSSTPVGMRAPSAWNFFGFSRNSLISCSSSTASSTPATSRKVIFGESADIRLARDLPNDITFEPPPWTWFIRNSQKPRNSTNGRMNVSRLSSSLLFSDSTLYLTPAVFSSLSSSGVACSRKPPSQVSLFFSLTSRTLPLFLNSTDLTSPFGSSSETSV